MSGTFLALDQQACEKRKTSENEDFNCKLNKLNILWVAEKSDKLAYAWFSWFLKEQELHLILFEL